MQFATPPPLPANKSFRIGIVGAGFIVDNCHLPAYRQAGFNPVALTSLNPTAAADVAARHGVPKVHPHPDALLDDPSLEILDIAVPPHQQAAIIQAACQRRTLRGILAQKPLGLNLAEGIDLVRRCQEAGITLAVNQNMRYDPSVHAAQALLQQHILGNPILATIDMRAIPHWMPWQRELGSLTLRIMSIHHLDTFRLWFGNPSGIYCSTRTDPRTPFPHTDGICCYILDYPGGLRCMSIDDTWTGPAREGCPADTRIQWRIEGTQGLAMGDIGWCKDPYTSPSSIRYARIGDSQFHAPTLQGSWFPDAFAGTMAELLRAVETNSQPCISGLDNLHTLALVDAAYASAQLQQRVTLPDLPPLKLRTSPDIQTPGI